MRASLPKLHQRSWTPLQQPVPTTYGLQQTENSSTAIIEMTKEIV
jgi:hypothetical protein